MCYNTDEGKRCISTLEDDHMADFNTTKLDPDDLGMVSGGVCKNVCPGSDKGLVYSSSDTEEMIKKEQDKARKNAAYNIGILRA